MSTQEVTEDGVFLRFGDQPVPRAATPIPEELKGVELEINHKLETINPSPVRLDEILAPKGWASWNYGILRKE